MRFANIGCLLPLVLSCTDNGPLAPKGDDPFRVVESGKADGSGMLPEADQVRLETAFDNAITAGEATVASLEHEIATLEAKNTAKQKEADALVARIASREQDLRDQYNRNLIFCAFFPNPVTCIFANYLLNDSTLTQYHRDLDAARAQQATIASSLASYRAKRDGLRAKLPAIRDAKARLVTLLHNGTTVEIPAELAGSAETGRAFQRAAVVAKLGTAIGGEIAVLVDIRNAAVELSQVLDDSLRTLRALEQSVDQLVEAQRKAFMDHLFDFLSGDPGAIADRWLEDALASRTRDLLNTLRWPLNEFARYLVETRGDGSDVDALVERLVRKLGTATTVDPIVLRANTPVQILDNTDAKSPIQVAATRAFTSLEVFVDIKHTFIGDLFVWVEHGGRQFVLSNRVGGSTHDMAKTFSITDLQGVALVGPWTLHVEDKAAQDTGTLQRWELTVR